MFKKFIGKKSNKILNRIERKEVKKFAESIGDLNPLYIDEEYGKKSIYQNNIAPPTFPQTIEYSEVEGLYLPVDGLIHGEQKFEYNRPLIVGEKIYCFVEVADYYEKEGRNEGLSFLIRNRYGEEEKTNKIIFKITEVTIITETVKRRLGE